MDNKVELLGYYGSDEVIACSAWTSTSRNLTDEKRGRIQRLIEMLWVNGHETPFEKGSVHFLVDTDIASHIHLLKHRISSLNAESARYKELKEDKYFIPEDWQGIKPSKPLSQYLTDTSLYDLVNYYGKDHSFKDDDWCDILERYVDQGNKLYHQCVEDLTPALGRKRAKESARFFKTYNSQIQADITFNMRSFANFQKLRNSEHAQVEIRDIAAMMLELVQGIEGNPFKFTLEAFKLTREM